MPQLATLSIIDNFERKIHGIGALRAGKWFTLFISNEDIDSVIRIVKLGLLKQ